MIAKPFIDMSGVTVGLLYACRRFRLFSILAQLGIAGHG